jgi:hypothetical protein
VRSGEKQEEGGSKPEASRAWQLLHRCPLTDRHASMQVEVWLGFSSEAVAAPVDTACGSSFCMSSRSSVLILELSTSMTLRGRKPGGRIAGEEGIE